MSFLRDAVWSGDKWNVEALYENQARWQEELDSLGIVQERPRWPKIQNFRGKLSQGASLVVAFIKEQLQMSRQLHKLYTWAHLRHDEEICKEEFKQDFNTILAILNDFEQEVSWFEPELLSLSAEELKALLESPELQSYRFYLEKIINMKPHTLSIEGEELVAMVQQPLAAIGKTFSALNDADFDFGTVKDASGSSLPLTHGQYGSYIRSSDVVLRESAFKKMLNKYLSFENSLCELINGQVQKNIFNSRARRFSSSLEASLFPKNIDTSVYHSLIKAVNNKLPLHHKYMQLRKRLLKLDKMHLWDIYVPLTPNIDMKMDYNTAEEMVIAAVEPLGEEYQQILSNGLKIQRWVDRYENKNKRSGAYSSGCYDSFPYILMNFNGLLRDAFTLAHEAGHSMHSFLSNQSQPYHYADYSIFLAEVASTFNEELLMRYLLNKTEKKEEKIFLINQKIEDIRTTLFRQTMFAEFELLIHELVEKGAVLTPTLLKERYRELNCKYFGKEVIIDEQIDIEWAKIPHFYYNFYVYQYATGISAALALCSDVVEKGGSAREGYLNFLRLGGSCYPLDALERAGIDMRRGEAVEKALVRFGKLVEELDRLTR